MRYLVINENREVIATEENMPPEGAYSSPMQVVLNTFAFPIALPSTEMTEDGVKRIPGTILPEFTLDDLKQNKKKAIASVLKIRLQEPLDRYSQGQRQGWDYDVACAKAYQEQQTLESAGKLLIRVMAFTDLFSSEELSSEEFALASIEPEQQELIETALNDLTQRIIQKSVGLFTFRALAEGAADKLNFAVDGATTVEELDAIDPEIIPRLY